MHWIDFEIEPWISTRCVKRERSMSMAGFVEGPWHAKDVMQVIDGERSWEMASDSDQRWEGRQIATGAVIAAVWQPRMWR